MDKVSCAAWLFWGFALLLSFCVRLYIKKRKRKKGKVRLCITLTCDNYYCFLFYKQALVCRSQADSYSAWWLAVTFRLSLYRDHYHEKEEFFKGREKSFCLVSCRKAGFKKERNDSLEIDIVTIVFFSIRFVGHTSNRTLTSIVLSFSFP